MLYYTCKVATHGYISSSKFQYERWCTTSVTNREVLTKSVRLSYYAIIKSLRETQTHLPMSVKGNKWLLLVAVVIHTWLGLVTSKVHTKYRSFRQLSSHSSALLPSPKQLTRPQSAVTGTPTRSPLKSSQVGGRLSSGFLAQNPVSKMSLTARTMHHQWPIIEHNCSC